MAGHKVFVRSLTIFLKISLEKEEQDTRPCEEGSGSRKGPQELRHPVW